MSKFRLSSVLLAIFVTGAYTVVVNADDHAWRKYHWDLSTAGPPLELGDNLDGIWAPLTDTHTLLFNAADDWNSHSVLKNEIVPGAGHEDCAPEPGRVEVCNGDEGDNGWLGIASVWVAQGKHIVKAVVKLNDWYFNNTGDYISYNSDIWRIYVICQEVGHIFGLDHNNEIFGDENKGTCMDYTDDPEGTDSANFQASNLQPNRHDRVMLDEIYAHLTPTVGGGGDDGGDDGDDGAGKGKSGDKGPKKAGNAGAIDLNDPSQWGQAIRQDARGQNILFERNLANGQVLITHVLWAN